jgi:hypothetical protein
MFWDRQRAVLHRISKQWLNHGAIEGRTSGQFFVETAGNLVPIP